MGLARADLLSPRSLQPKGPRRRPRLVDPSGRPVASASSSQRFSGAAFEGAGSGRRLLTWGTSTAGPNSTVFASLSRLRSRSRELARNNALAAGAIDSLVSNIVGSGITPRWQIGLDNPALKEELQALWQDSQQELDHSGFLDFYGLQSLVARTVIQSGECLVRLILLPGARGGRRAASSYEAVPIKLQVLEPDHLDEAYNAVLPNGHTIRMGIEFDSRGRRVAYHIFREHPGESAMMAADRFRRIRVPASRILHIGRPHRPGQIRFIPWLSSIIVRLHELDQYQDAELVRKKTAAMFGGFIEEPLSSDVNPYEHLGHEDTDAEAGESEPSAADAVVALEPGTFPILPRGMTVSFSQPADVGGNFEAFMLQELRAIAKGIGLTYEQLTGDLTDVNYSSIRAGLIEFRRQCLQFVQQIMVFQFCRPAIAAWLDAAVLSGAVDIPDYMERRRYYQRISWHHAGFEWVDPEKDLKAAKAAVRSGFRARSQVIAELGLDAEQVDSLAAEDNARADRLGLVLDSDPRRTASNGAARKDDKREETDT